MVCSLSHQRTDLTEYLQYISCWIEFLSRKHDISIVKQSTIQIDREEQVCFKAPITLLILNILGNKHSQLAVSRFL
jgi:hypothetical protein